MQHLLSEQTIPRCFGCLAVLFQGSFDSKSTIPVSAAMPAGGWVGARDRKGEQRGGVAQHRAKPWSALQPTLILPGDTEHYMLFCFTKK